MVVVVNSVSILAVPLALVRFRLKVDGERATKKDVENIAKSLVKSKRTIEICNKDNSPISIQVGEVILAANTFAIKKSLAKLSKEEQGILARWIKVFSNKSSLGLSFREPSKGFSPDFLRASPNFDQGAIGTLLCLCNKCEDFNQELTKATVFLLVTIVEYAQHRMVEEFGWTVTIRNCFKYSLVPHLIRTPRHLQPKESFPVVSFT